MCTRIAGYRFFFRQFLFSFFPKTRDTQDKEETYVRAACARRLGGGGAAMTSAAVMDKESMVRGVGEASTSGRGDYGEGRQRLNASGGDASRTSYGAGGEKAGTTRIIDGMNIVDIEEEEGPNAHTRVAGGLVRLMCIFSVVLAVVACVLTTSSAIGDVGHVEPVSRSIDKVAVSVGDFEDRWNYYDGDEIPPGGATRNETAPKPEENTNLPEDADAVEAARTSDSSGDG